MKLRVKLRQNLLDTPGVEYLAIGNTRRKNFYQPQQKAPFWSRANKMCGLIYSFQKRKSLNFFYLLNSPSFFFETSEYDHLIFMRAAI